MGTYFSDIFSGIGTAWVGMKITFMHLFERNVTNQYPDNYHPITSGDMPKNSRNRIFVEIAGCDGCNGCARACPVNCIKVDIVKVTPGDKGPLNRDGKEKKVWVTKFDIDFAKCCFCSLCTEACPTEAIVMTQEFEYSVLNRDNLLYSFEDLSAQQADAKKKMWANYMAEKKKAEAEAAKKAEDSAKQ